MAKYREVVCMYYISHGKCKKNRGADHNHYCQKCDKYRPRAKMHLPNKKKIYNDKQKGKVY